MPTLPDMPMGFLLVGWGFFVSPWHAGEVGCHVLQSAVRIGCVVRAAFGPMEGARRWDYAPCWGGGITFTCGLNLLQQMGFQLSLWEPAELHHCVCTLCFQRLGWCRVQPGA